MYLSRLEVKDYRGQVFRMSLLRLNINQQFAQIGVRSTPARMNISMPKGQMRITTETPQMNIDKKAPSFRINRKKINNESGLKGPLELAKTFRNKGRSNALQAAANYKNDGNFIANPHIPGDKSIPMLSKNKMKRALAQPEYNVGLMPASSPEITWDKGHMNVNWSRHSVRIDYVGDSLADISIDPKHSVEVYLRTRPSFRVTVEEIQTDNIIGRFINSLV